MGIAIFLQQILGFFYLGSIHNLGKRGETNLSPNSLGILRGIFPKAHDGFFSYVFLILKFDVLDVPMFSPIFWKNQKLTSLVF
jgi:hypothetical protein